MNAPAPAALAALAGASCARALAVPVHAYRFFVSPLLGSCCRFYPSCSAYALESLERHGPLKGSYLAVARLARCHPWCAGGYDPVPVGTTAARLSPLSSAPHAQSTGTNQHG